MVAYSMEAGGLEGWKAGRLEGWGRGVGPGSGGAEPEITAGRMEGWKAGGLEGWKAGRLGEGSGPGSGGAEVTAGWKAGRLEGWKARRAGAGADGGWRAGGLEGWTAEGLVPRRSLRLRSPELRGRAAASDALDVRAGDPGLEGWNGGWAAGSARAGGLEGLPAGSRAQVVQPFVE